MATISAEMKECIEQVMSYKQGRSELEESIAKLKNISGLSRDVVKVFLTNVKRDNIVKFPAQFRKKQHGTKLN